MRVPCRRCRGTGTPPKGGYHQHNPVKLDTIVGRRDVTDGTGTGIYDVSVYVESKWTAMEKTFGWRHFQVIDKTKNAEQTYLLLTATCDNATQFWVNSITP